MNSQGLPLGCQPLLPSAPGLSAGAIAGIVIGSVAAVALLAGLGLWGYKKKKSKGIELKDPVEEGQDRGEIEEEVDGTASTRTEVQPPK